MKQMGVETPVFGLIFDYMNVADGGEIKAAELIHPKVEAEIAFVLKTALRGPGCHIGAVLAATDFVMPAVEIVDSRYENFRFDLASVIAAVAAGAAVLGHPAAAVAMLANTMAQRGEEVSAGTFILSGGATEAIPVAVGDAIHVRFQGMGSVSMRFV